MNLQISKTITLSALLTLCAMPNTVSAFIAGSKAAGMASTGIAYPQDGFAGAYNPAGSVAVSDRFDLGFAWLRNHGHAKVKMKHPPASKDGKDANGTFNAFKSPNFYDFDLGINKNFCTSLCGTTYDWSLGLVIYNRDFQKTTYNKPLLLLGRSKLGLEYVHETISPLFSLQLTESHSIGLSVDVHIQRLKASGLQQFDHTLFSVSPGNVTNKGYAYSSGVGATFGWKWQPYDDLTFGVTYRTKTSMRKLNKYKGLIAQHGLLDTPERWGVGVAYQFLLCATLTLDVEWINWQKIGALHHPLLHNGTSQKFGSTNGPGFGFRNQTIYRIGIDYAFSETWIFRAGFRHGNSFVRNSETVMNGLLCDTIENIATIGFSYTFNSCNEISFFYAHGFKNSIHGKHSIPKELGSGNVDLTQSNNSLGITWGHFF